MNNEAIVALIRAVVKARPSADGRRIVEVEASSEAVDSEGDVVMQSALMGAAKGFVANGHLDIDHLSEIGDRVGIENPTSYIVGRPIEVRDVGGGRTSVVGEIMRGRGAADPRKNKFDEFWESLQRSPPVVWRASIYGFPIPGMVDDCRGSRSATGATRFVIRGIDWRSLAFTRNPVNTDLIGCARVLTAKSYVARIMAKSSPIPTASLAPLALGQGDPQGDVPTLATETFPDDVPIGGPASMSMGPARGGAAGQTMRTFPIGMSEMVGEHALHISRGCPHAMGLNTTVGFREHFVRCRGLHPEDADIAAHALMHHLAMARRRRAS